MTPDIPFEVDFPIVVPQRLRHLLNQNLRKATRLVVNENVGDGQAPKVNGFRLTNTHGGLPDEGVDEIAQAVTAVMHIAWRDQETEDPEIGMPPMAFIVVCEHTTKNNGTKKGKRTRLSFTYVYKGDLVDDDDFVDDEITMEERSIQRAMETLERQNSSLIGHVDLLHHTMLAFVKQQSESSAAQGAASSEMMKHAIPMFFGGIQQMLNAQSMKYDIAKAEAEAKSSSERFVNSIKAVAPFIGMAAQQWIAHKFPGVDIGSVFAGGAPTEGSGPASPPDAEVDDQVPRDLVAFFASQLGTSLSNAQRRMLSEKFKVAEMRTLDDLFCATTDDEAVSAYERVVKVVGAKLTELHHLLTAEQGQMLQMFFQALQQHAERRASSHPPPSA